MIYSICIKLWNLPRITVMSRMTSVKTIFSCVHSRWLPKMPFAPINYGGASLFQHDTSVPFNMIEMDSKNNYAIIQPSFFFIILMYPYIIYFVPAISSFLYGNYHLFFSFFHFSTLDLLCFQHSFLCIRFFVFLTYCIFGSIRCNETLLYKPLDHRGNFIQNLPS